MTPGVSVRRRVLNRHHFGKIRLRSFAKRGFQSLFCHYDPRQWRLRGCFGERVVLVPFSTSYPIRLWLLGVGVFCNCRRPARGPLFSVEPKAG